MAFLYGGDLIDGGDMKDLQINDKSRLFPIENNEEIVIARRLKVRVVADDPLGVDTNNPITFRISSQSGSAIDLCSIGLDYAD